MPSELARAKREHFAGMRGRVVLDRGRELVVRFRDLFGTEHDELWTRCPGDRGPGAFYEQTRRLP